MSANIYNDIATRTQGDIYIGVVGPVRTGKSTFIKKFMDYFVIPKIDNPYKKERATDELPQSAAGRTIMTTEPKFIPNEAVRISFDGNKSFMNVRMIDCVGYIVPSAIGYIENEAPRMVKTPWFDEEISFNEAAEMGTKKVINEHSTIGLVVTTDGSITDIPRSDYVEAENRVIEELKAIGKPFVILVNSTDPSSDRARGLCDELYARHNVCVRSVNCAELTEKDIDSVLESVLYEFPVCEIGINIPRWIDALENNHYLKSSIYSKIRETVYGINKISQINSIIDAMSTEDYVSESAISNVDLGNGTVLVDIGVIDGLFYKIIKENTGFDIDNEDKLMRLLIRLSDTDKQYSRIQFALHQVRENGYGIVSPDIDELTLEEPEIIKQGGRYGVRLRASAPSIHMMRADIETEVAPIVGTEKESEELVHYLLEEFEADPAKLWESDIFGKSLHELVNEGLNNKLSRMPEDARGKIRETLERIINEGSGGLICIIL
ncbi:MAG: stage IV sporulation protein A [Bacillota bacterium]|nr:stage IV sporulation protein A [Bacillota bacterium]